ncbi:MAG TPA: hypothetical protein VKY19_04340 [Ktedonosporobacter sp.]|jgi:N12 class adenine-specific DNA methylase|nr:hypothetical protein [Ktedonosporobacter sp.]
MQTLTSREQERLNDANASAPIVELVELVNTIQREQRQATDREQALLASWMGWGPLAPAFEPSATGKWADIGTRLRLLLGPLGMEAASAATPTSFFTSDFLARIIWQLATRLGFSGGRVLEPGCGSGAILAAAPAGLFLQMTGIEREPFSARVAQLRLPTATIIPAPFEKVSLVNTSFDLVVGNVPFSSVRIYDPDCAMNFSLHNYFLWRALMALRPGGLAILITSLYTLDTKRSAQRTLLSNLGSLLGALRLPSNAHQQAGTEVVTDILVLQRHTLEVPWRGQPWMDLSPEVVPGISVNEYFARCPRQIIGTPVMDRGMYRADELRVIAPDNLAEALEEGVERLVETARSNGARYLPPPDYTTVSDTLVRRREDGRKEGSYHLLGDRLFQIRDGEPQPVTRHIAELTMLVQLRNTAIELLEAERDLDRPDAELEPARALLNACYDAYVRTYGPIHRATISSGPPDPETGERTVIRRRPLALSAFSMDPEYVVVLGLEHYDSVTQQAQKAHIFRQRVHRRPERKSATNSPAEALALCLDGEGALNFETIGQLLSCDVSEVPARLGELVYEDPVSGTWLTAEAYLCGNVRTKLAEARRAAAVQPGRFARNVTALEATLPEDLEPEEISAVLGASWIPPADIEQFCLETFGTRPAVSYEPLTATWEVTLPSGVVPSLAATSDWGTRELHAFRLVEIGLNKGIPVVYEEMEEKRVRNIEETLAAQDKLQSIQARFREWVWEEDERARRLADVYNTLFNAIVPQRYNGSHLSFPGMDETWASKLYPWQRDFVWRMVSSPAALCGHPVGAGKTTTEIAGAMTLRRFGLITKAAIVVPNHLLEQIAAEAGRLYPGARILMIARDDLSRERRTLFAARVALGDFDVVIMTHASLNALGVHPETEQAYLEQRIAVYRQALLDLDEAQQDRTHKRIIKRLETTIEKMRQRQRELVRLPRDQGITFEQLGISYLIIDEAHLYKNLGLPTNIQGLQVQPSKRAVDLEMKLRWLEKHTEGRPFASFFTATPISNSMVEAYVQAWYLNQSLLQANGLTSVDAFASTFIELQTRVEVSPNGASFRLHTRPSRFVNMPEFLSLFAQFADLRGPEILDDKRPARREHTITIPPDEAVQRYVDDLVERCELIQQGKPRDMGAGRLDNMLWVTTHGRAAAVDLSLVGVLSLQTPKLSAVASTMLAVYRRVQRESVWLEGEFKGLQIGFCDLGTPNEESEQVYGRLKQLLIDGGIPAHGIRSMLMGVGTNIQTRCAAIHHIDAPWRPDEVEQREGRGHRPGNRYRVVEIYRYVQQRTFDAYSWQTLTTKAVFFDQMRRGKITTREMDAQGETALSYAQVKAAATGDPLVLEQAELDVTIAQLQRLQTAHLRARKREAQDAAQARSTCNEARIRAASLRALAATVARCARPGLTTRSGEYLTKRSAIGAVIAREIQTALASGEGEVALGSWSGEKVAARIEIWGTAYVVSLHIGTNALRIDVYQSWMDAKQQWRFAEAIQQAVTSASEKAQWQERVAERAEEQAALLERQAARPFPRAAELQARLQRKAELDAYTALVAAVKGDPARQADLAERRAQLLTDRPDFAFEPVGVSSLPAAKSTSAVVPRFGEWWIGNPGRRRARRENPPEQAGKQLSLFPDLLEQGA